MNKESFASRLVAWQKEHGRQALPWQYTGDAYKVWLSEVMLQQTQVATVLAYYQRFLQAFPTVVDLAKAPEEQVMHLWAGLGYYSRARNLHACAKQVVDRFCGVFPSAVADLESLSGIGRSTAGAIASLAYGQPAAILDGNVKRVLSRYFCVEGYPEQSAVKKQLWAIADREVPKHEAGRYNQALMDLGATVCLSKSPKCGVCPLMPDCVGLRKGMVHLLPMPKPKKPRPNVYFVCLILKDSQGKVLLQKQLQKGIWQKLWMFPAVQVEDETQATLTDLEHYVPSEKQGDLSKQLAQLDTQPWLIHELTHRKMHYKCMSIQLDEERPDFVELDSKPVPRLVHKLMAFILSRHSDA